MINEIVFLIHIMLICLIVTGAYRLGQHALISVIALLCVLGNLFVLKQTILFSLNATCADAFAVGATIGIALLHNRWGQELAHKSTIINFYAMAAYTTTTFTQLWYHPAPFDTMNDHFIPLLSPAPRIIIASMCAYFIAQQTTIYLQKYVKNTTLNNYSLATNYLILFTAHLLDTIVFSFIGLYGIVHNIADVMIISMVIKTITIFLATPFINLLQQK